MTIRSSDLRQRVIDAQPKRVVVKTFDRVDGWTLTIEIQTGAGMAPSLVLRTLSPRDRGSQVRVLAHELPALEDAIARIRSETP